MAAEYDVSDVDFNQMIVKQLRNYLRERNQKVTGVKDELIERARGAHALKLKKTTQVSDVVDTDVKQSVLSKLRTPGGFDMPDPSCLNSGWTDNFDLLPEFNERDMYNYLVLSTHRSVDSKPLKAIRQLKAAIFYEDRHVHSVAIHTITDGCDHMFVKCDVIPSLPTTDKGNNPDHHVWVCLSKVTGRVHSAYCTCAAGAGESCNHVAALLYALVDISQKKTDGESCTSRQCKWIIPRARKLAPLTSDNLNLMSSGRKSILKRKIEETITHQEPSLTECLPNSGMPQTTINVERFRNRLCTSESKKKCGYVLTTSNYSDPDVNNIQAESACLPQLPVLDKCFCDHVDLSSVNCQDVFQNYFESIKVSEVNAATIERVTRGQQKQEQWKEARKERITSSDFGKVCVRRSSTEPDRLVHHVLGYGKEFSSVHTKWGITHEAAARQLYTLRMTQTHHDIKVSQCGLIVNPMYPYLGASPDGLVCCENCEHCKSPQGLLEIKCPSALRDLTPQDAALHTDFFCTVDGHNNLKLKENHPYFFQVQGQMAITQRKWVDFVVWTLKGMSIQRIKFDEFKWEEMCQKLRSFYLTAIVPELFSRRVYRGFKLCPLA